MPCGHGEVGVEKASLVEATNEQKHCDGEGQGTQTLQVGQYG